MGLSTEIKASGWQWEKKESSERERELSSHASLANQPFQKFQRKLGLVEQATSTKV